MDFASFRLMPGGWWCGYGAAGAMDRAMKDLGALRRSGRIPRGVPDRRMPRSFTTFLDPKFELSYPAGWGLQAHPGAVRVTSERIGSRIRVDVVEDSVFFWGDFEKTTGASIHYVRDGTPEHGSGTVTLEGRRFDCEFYAWRKGGTAIVLTTYNVVYPRRSKALEAFEEWTLRAIARNFKARV